MSEIAATYPEGRGGKRSTVLWETLACGDTGAWIELGDFNDNTVTISGTFNSQTVTMQGANAADKSDAFTLTDNIGLSIALTAAGGKLISEAPRYVRPSFSGSSGGDVDVLIELRKS